MVSKHGCAHLYIISGEIDIFSLSTQTPFA